MIAITRDNDLFTIKFERADVSEGFLNKLLRKFEVEKGLEKNQMTEEQAWELSEEVKESWWNKNQERIEKMIGIKNERSN